MKTIKNIGLKLAVIMAVFMAVPAVGQAQVKKGYAEVDWQFNVPLVINLQHCQWLGDEL